MSKPIVTEINIEDRTENYNGNMKIEIAVRNLKPEDHKAITGYIKKIQQVIHQYGGKNGSN